MIRTIVDVQVESGEPGTFREAVPGEQFPVGVLVEAGPFGPVVFDTILIDVVYNSGSHAQIHIAPGERPVAGELVARGGKVVDARTGEPLKAGRLTDKPPLSGGTPMAMPEKTELEAVGPYQARTGAAGYRGSQPFVLKAGEGPVGFAYGMVEARLDGTRAAETSIWTTGYALYKDEPVPIAPARSIVRVATRRTGGR